MASKSRKRKRRGGNFQAPAKRGQAGSVSQPAGAPISPRRPTRGRRERPPSPWGAFPLVELVVLLAVVMLIAGFIVSNTAMIAAGMALGMLAGLELSIREHFAGYKSHSTVLAGLPGLIVLGIGSPFLLDWPPGVNLVAAALVFTAGFYLLREAFKRRSGGVGFR